MSGKRRCGNCEYFETRKGHLEKWRSGDKRAEGNCCLNPPAPVPGYREGEIDWLQSETKAGERCSHWKPRDNGDSPEDDQ